MSDVRVVDFDAERTVRSLDLLERVTEGELRDETARPSILIQLVLLLEFSRVELRYIPLLRIFKHVSVCLNWIALANLNFVLATQLRK